jgi:1,2-diacylglycerol 3-alpha-glucosyltransferase
MNEAKTTLSGRSLSIAMVAACPFPTSQGSQVLIREMSEALSRRGHHVHLVTYHFGEDQPCPGLTIHRIPEVFRYNKFRSGPEIRKPLLDLLLMRKLDQVVVQENIQVIHAHNYEAPVAAFPVRWRRKVPVVYHSHNTMSDEFYTYFRLKIPQVLARGAAHLMDRYIPRQADFTIAINRRVANFLIEQGVSADKIKYIPPGIEFADQVLPPDPELRRELNLGEGPLILYTGNLDDYQRLDLLLAALPEIFVQHPSARLVLLTGSNSSCFMQQARTLGVESRIISLTHPCISKVREIMALGTVAVNPRISWSGFPIKLLNYMASGLPVVAFTGAAAPIIDGVNGLLAPPEEVKAFAQAVSSLIAQPALARKMGEAGRALVQEHYTWAAISCDIERVYHRVIGKTN